MTDLARQDGAEADDAGSFEIHAEVTSVWAAPLPRPEVLAGYNDAFPGCAERIVAMAEEQSRHRQALEAAVIRGNVYSQKAGLWLGFLLALLVISCGAFLIYSGKTGWGTGLISVPLISLVSVFVIGKRDQRRSRDLDAIEPAQSRLPFPPSQE